MLRSIAAVLCSLAWVVLALVPADASDRFPGIARFSVPLETIHSEPSVLLAIGGILIGVSCVARRLQRGSFRRAVLADTGNYVAPPCFVHGQTDSDASTAAAPAAGGLR